MHPARLFIVGGLPGSGKTARATELVERFGGIRTSADDLSERLGLDIWDEDARSRVEVYQHELAADALRSGTNVVVEWGSWTRRERDQLLATARRAGAMAHLVFLDEPVDVLWQRISDRSHEQRFGSRIISHDDLVDWSAIVERPTDEERSHYDTPPPLRAGERPGGPAFPYGSWRP